MSKHALDLMNKIADMVSKSTKSQKPSPKKVAKSAEDLGNDQPDSDSDDTNLPKPKFPKKKADVLGS